MKMQHALVLLTGLALAACARPSIQFQELRPSSLADMTGHANFQAVDVRSFERAEVRYVNHTSDDDPHRIPAGQFVLELVLARIKPDPAITSVRLAEFNAQCIRSEYVLPHALCSGTLAVTIRRGDVAEAMTSQLARQDMGNVYSVHDGAQDAVIGQVQKFLTRLVLGAKTGPAGG